MRYFKNQQGYSLLLTFSTIILITVLGISLFTVTANTMKISKNERQDQSVFYIAESGVNLKKAEITNLLAIASRKAKASLNDYIEKVVLPDKTGQEFDLAGYYRNQLEREVDLLIPEVQTQTFDFYETQNDATPLANVTTKKTSTFNYLITSVGKIQGKSRTLTQPITLDYVYTGTGDYKSEDSVNILPTLPYNACIAVMSNETISSTGGGGVIKGDMYSKSAITINGSPSIAGNVFSPQSITISGTPTNIVNIYSKKDIYLSGSMTVKKNIIADGNINSKAHAGGSIISTNGGITISGGTIKENVLANQSSSISNSGGVIDGNFTIFNGDLSLKGGTIKGNVASMGNVSIPGYPTIGKNVYGKNIKADGYSSIGGTYYYSDTLQHPADLKNKLKSPETIQNYFKNLTMPTLGPIEDMLSRTTDPNITCNIISDMTVPNLSEPEYKTATNKAINYGQSLSNVYSFISNNNLILPSSHPKEETIEFTEDISFNELYVDKSLTIDLKGKSRTLYLNDLKMSADGKINIINPGQLTIYVKNNIDINAGASFNSDNLPDSVSIVYSGSSELNFAGGTAVNANLYIKNANLNMIEGGRVYGSIYAYGKNNITINGGASVNAQVIYAPKSDISQTSGGKVKGNIYANNYSFDGGIKVEAALGTGSSLPPSSSESTIDTPEVDTMLIEDPMIEL